MRRVFVGGLIILSLSFGGCLSWKRAFNDFKSNTVGIKRKVTVYDHSGNKLREYSGRIVIDGSGERTKITTSDMRVIIVDGGIVITEDMRGE
ncbi:MAG: hypothetical protein BV458_03420 [Thermoplasmata archaeon M9B2D]|nr:MAG: hypothetical protein BV458_03420 [Thermoplasmata archaeon M9B2D]